ncbi:MAG: hypothetical protein GW823_07555 [Bacteroidetes bacterium]|nr:hypothetical protein [Bacteroidota bacterium]
MLESTVDAYGTFAEGGHGLILLDLEDEVLDSRKTKEQLEKKYGVVTFEGGNHRFTHLKESLPLIRNSFWNSHFVYGFGDGGGDCYF